MNRLELRAITAAMLAICACQYALAQHGHEHKPAEFKMPTSYPRAVKEIEHRLANIAGLIQSKKLDQVHAEAEVIKRVGEQVGQLALKPDSGVPKDSVKEVNQAGKALAAKFDAIDKAGDSGDLAGTQREYDEMLRLAATLQKYTSKIFACPMKCEGAKTYDKAGSCPVCNMHLKQITDEKFSVEVVPNKGLKPGVETTLKFHLKDPAGKTVKNLQVVHEQILHLLMASEDLSWYAHEHPVVGADGTFTLKWAFPQPGKYVLYHDFTPEGVGMQVVPVEVMVEGTLPARIPLKADGDKPKTVDGYTFALDTGGPIKTGGAAHMAYTISKDGKPVNDLQPYLGAMGHLVIISQDLKEFVHSHPHEGGEHAAGGHDAPPAKDGRDEHGHAGGKKGVVGGPKVDFEAHFKAPGLYKGWAQFQHNGKVITVPFTFNVAPGDGNGAEPDGHKRGARPVNGLCPVTREVASDSFTRDFKGQLVGFHDAASATIWDGLTDEQRLSKFVAALAAAVPGDHDAGMPAGLEDAEARALYLTAGGKYTEADIKANGSVTADAKYKGVMSKHDFKPKVGDAICPITLTKVNPKFTWVIGGKTYQFCCPPCIDEFVLLAKESPDEIKDPSFYVKK